MTTIIIEQATMVVAINTNDNITFDPQESNIRCLLLRFLRLTVVVDDCIALTVLLLLLLLLFVVIIP